MVYQKDQNQWYSCTNKTGVTDFIMHKTFYPCTDKNILVHQ